MVGSGEAGEDASQKITSLKRLLDKKKKNRTGYEDEKHVLYDETTFFDYLESEDPYEYLTKFNRVSHFPLKLLFNHALFFVYS